MKPLTFTTSLSIFRRKIQFALFPFRSLLMGKSLLFSFPAGTKMFQFPAYTCLSARSCEHVVALGDLGFKARMRLPRAYRSLPRPSSPSKPSYPSNSLKYAIFKIANDQTFSINFFSHFCGKCGKLFTVFHLFVFLLASLNISLCMINQINGSP